MNLHNSISLSLVINVVLMQSKYKLTINLHITGTGIGNVYEAECEYCGECINLTDYGCW